MKLIYENDMPTKYDLERARLVRSKEAEGIIPTEKRKPEIVVTNNIGEWEMKKLSRYLFSSTENKQELNC